jgi:hypothetical protein
MPMGGFRHTGVANGSARSDYAALGQVQDGKVQWAAAGGTADALTATYSPAVTAIVDGQLACVRAGAANATTTPTLAVNGLTARTIVKNGGDALVAGDIAGAGHEMILRYDLTNTRWELLNPSGDLGALSRLDTVDTAQIDDDAVETAKINDDAVTLAKMAHGTQGGLIYYAASGVPTELAAGTDGYVLTAGGAGANPAWEAMTPSAITATYESAQLAATVGGTHSLTHSLGGRPRGIDLWLECTSDEYGYVAGERILVGYNTDIGGTASRGVAVKSTTTTIELKISGTAASIINFSTGAAVEITTASWRYVVTAWR